MVAFVNIGNIDDSGVLIRWHYAELRLIGQTRNCFPWWQKMLFDLPKFIYPNQDDSCINMNKQLLKDAFGWGLLLWLIGYALGIMLFALVPLSLIGWIIMPIGTVITLWVLLKKVKADSFGYYALLAVVWVLIAIVFDYFFLVKAFKPADGYYKPDVYLYYALTFGLPLIVGWKKAMTPQR